MNIVNVNSWSNILDEMVLIGRIATEQDFQGVVAFLASNLSSL